MSEAVVIALLSLGGTALGSLGGVVASAKLVNFRLAALETKVEKHNNLVERMVAVEQSVKSAHHRLDGLHEEVRHE